MIKMIVSAACVAVIAVAGLLFWDRYQASIAAEDRVELQTNCRNGIFTASQKGGADHLTLDTITACMAIGVDPALGLREAMERKARVDGWAAELTPRPQPAAQRP